MMKEITREAAKRFILARQGLIGPYRFVGKAGAFAYVRQAGCIQFDPVDVCGRNAELTLQSRVRGFRKDMLQSLLYEDHTLIDYSDKELSILPTEDWPYFAPYRERSLASGLRFEGLAELEKVALAYIREHGPVSSDTLPIPGTLYWHSSMHWSGNWGRESKASRSVLEQLYTDGVLVIHHKSGTRKFYDLAERHVDPSLLCAPNPCVSEEDWLTWRVARRIGAVGLLWNRRSDAFLGIAMDSDQRDAAFQALLAKGRILEVRVSGMPSPLYCLSSDASLLESAASQPAKGKRRLEFLAPLDPMLWDRKLIAALFDFAYTWEIYTPKEKRKYGYYVLPVLYGERFIGRIEMAADAKTRTLTVRHLWLEEGVRETDALRSALSQSLQRFAGFSLCTDLVWEDRKDGPAHPALIQERGTCP